jgi:CTP:molybdopterin cytidylyltransferase MocA
VRRDRHHFVVSAMPPAALLAETSAPRPVDDPGGGQGARSLPRSQRADNGAVLVVNADVPCVVPHDLRTLAGTAELDAVGFVEAEDGTTNALVLPRRPSSPRSTARAAPIASASTSTPRV